MSTNDKNGPAFPQHPDMPSQMGCITCASDAGMSLRDYFAAKAMQAQLSMPEMYVVISNGDATVAKLCDSCFEWADAMLEARK